ncbi:MAG TPA: large conductance mechanosensitive channel protein MscL [Puia sp.]|nr:large conductance mechanosensitive channel protein MscL [Puia sp.]
MGFIKDFRDFAMRGNVIDLAVGVIIGGAFGKIVDSIVNDMIMPLVGIFFKADFTNLYYPLSEKVKLAHEANPSLSLVEAKKLGPVFAWGNFVTVSLNFIILALIIFWMVRMIQRVKHSAPPPPPEPSATEKLLTEIRDELRK